MTTKSKITKLPIDKPLDILIDEMDGSLWVGALSGSNLQALEVDPINEEVRWGSIYWAKVARIDATLDAAFLDLDGENQGILSASDIRKDKKVNADTPIGKLVKAGEFLLVQAKEGKLAPSDNVVFENKVPRLSMNISFQGRYLIYMPFENDSRISRRIRDEAARKQLAGMLKEMVDCKSCILRAAAQNTQTDMLIREHKILHTMWDQLSKYANGDEAHLVMLGPDAVQRTLSDMAIRTIDRIEVTTMEQFGDTEEWCELFAPDLVTKINPIELENPYDNLALFEERDVLDQIDELFQPYKIMKSGATVILQETSALVAVDVNRGAATGSVYSINKDAAIEVARQIRLRNLGGIIIIDFLKMKKKSEQGKFVKELTEIFDTDPCTVQVHGLTKLGLLEITRQRRTPPLHDRFESAQLP